MGDECFFTPVAFETPEDPSESTNEKIVTWDKEKLRNALQTIEEELDKVKDGTSEYVPRAIDPGRFGFPAQNAMRLFVNNPSDKTFEGILDICRQDFGSRAGDYFHGLLKKAREESNE